ncbi:Pimeloyl-ACP methyl ester carboxylesterase [Reichenbachiella faecimaris]|uniref:Pimeloyl-ACP methyl ester carboxylesterase n=1 Tax=Reichenbachiella faecimaris TaxID=692418 RepID=A0A1W2G7Y0_REIFA|nr:alpha/beta fold hydrolase [Reichenbachiella faecimaris]SMD32789.1 Pimeloyl-ACP methyl ester carboxylesterase [Reichenbachiella faecimaris]
MKPATQYTKSGRINIAYQIFGSGPVDLVYIPGWVSNIDWMWACPELVHFFEELGKIARVILFDKRGTGLSDRVVELSTLEERMDDIRAVMDAVGSEKAILFGHSEGGSVSALFAATYPKRTVSLITFGVFAKRRYDANYPWAPTDEERQKVYDMIENSWGSGDMNLESLAPSKADDEEFMDWLANYFRSGASPSAAMVLTKMNTEVDIIDILGSIDVPTLMMQRTNDIDVKIDEGKFIAERIKGAKFVEFDGDDHLFWVGNTQEVLREMKSFITEIEPNDSRERQLVTILAARIISSDNKENQVKQTLDRYINQYKGRFIQYNAQRFIATFTGPSKAVHCSLDLANALRKSDVQLAAGVHIKECSLGDSQSIGEQTEDFVDSIIKQIQPNEILITQTVKHLLSGAGLTLNPHPGIYASFFDESLSLYSVKNYFDDDEDIVPIQKSTWPQNSSLLENVLQSIEEHLSNESFGVDTLCKELGISERQLQRKLKAITNKSPNQLISSVRLHRAKELILNQQLNISEVAFQTGFSSPSYFSKSFKKEFSLSPTDLLQ